jgi:hypothetical protein
MDEHEPYRPEPRPRFGKVVPAQQETGRRDEGCGNPDDHPDRQDPRRGSRRHHDEARNDDGQTHVPHAESPDGDPPRRVVLQLRRLVHATERDGSTPGRPESLVPEFSEAPAPGRLVRWWPPLEAAEPLGIRSPPPRFQEPHESRNTSCAPLEKPSDLLRSGRVSHRSLRVALRLKYQPTP